MTSSGSRYSDITIAGRVYTAVRDSHNPDQHLIVGGPTDNPNSGRTSDFTNAVAAIFDAEPDLYHDDTVTRTQVLLQLADGLRDLDTFDVIAVTPTGVTTVLPVDETISQLENTVFNAEWVRRRIASAYTFTRDMQTR